MKRLWVMLILVLAGFGFVAPAEAQETPRVASLQVASPQQAVVLCPPGVYTQPPEDCLPLGPSDYLGRLASQGITLPIQPLPAYSPDPALSKVDYFYAMLKADQVTHIYPTLDAALAQDGATDTLGTGLLKYISYSDVSFFYGREKPDAFMLRSGGWVSSADVAARIRGLPTYQGLLFTRSPSHAFGWIIPLSSKSETKHTPGYQNQDYTGHLFVEYDVVQVFAETTVNGEEWYLVGPDEWIEGRLVGRVQPSSKPPEGVTGGRWIEINLLKQTLAVYENNQLVFATLVATGVDPFWTRPGTFQIFKKLDTTPMSGAFEADRSDYYYLQDVPWTMYFDDARALHAAYWRTRFGFQQSHGCVNLSPGDAHWLYSWGQVGDWVYVYDPSGKTPTDPKYYTAGAP
jgi:hypothetical protein